MFYISPSVTEYMALIKGKIYSTPGEQARWTSSGGRYCYGAGSLRRHCITGDIEEQKWTQPIVSPPAS